MNSAVTEQAIAMYRPVAWSSLVVTVVPTLLTAALAIACSDPAYGQPAWEAQPLQGHDLAERPLYLDQRWDGGILRVRLVAESALPPDWRIHLDYGDGETMDIESATAGARIVGGRSRDHLTLDLPVLAPRTLRVQVNPAGLRLPIIAVLFHSTANSQQMIGERPKIDLFDAEVKPKERLMGPAFGRLDLMGTSGELIGGCTAFRVARGYWLTAAHCVARDPEYRERVGVATLRLQPLDYAHALEGASLYAAVPIATGQSGGQPDPGRYLQENDLDYAVLKVQDDPGGLAFSITPSAVAKPGVQLELFQHWAGSLPPTGGKARSADGECVIRERWGPDDPSRPDLCPSPALQHGCSSEPGASGGPVVARSSLHLVGLHYRGGQVKQFNCLLPAIAIIKHLCGTRSAIAERITTCK